MAKSLITESLIAESTAPEASLNAMVLLAANMTAQKTRTAGLPVPDDEKFDDAGDIGNGINGEFPTEQRSGFITPPTWDFSNIVDAGNFVTKLRRFMGGADAVPSGANIIEAGVAFQHNFAQLANNTAAGRQLPSSTWAYSNNGADYLYGGVLYNTLQVTQQGAADPTFTIGCVGSGLYSRIRNISGPAFGTLAAPTKQPKMLGAESVLSFTDGGGLLNLTAAHRLINFTFNASNAIDTTTKLAGASRVNPTDLTQGWYLDELLHGVRTASATMRIYLDDTMREYSDARNNTIVTGFKFTMSGYNIPTTAAANRYTVELIFGKCYFRSVRGADDNGNAVLDIDIFPVTDNVNFGLFTARVVNGVATAIA